jgi:hypothetical protein
MWGLLFLPFMAWGTVCFFLNRRDRLSYQLLRALGWISLCALPVPFVAAISKMLRDGEWAEAFLHFAIAPLITPIFLGGQTVVSLFEENVRNWTGHRRDTMFDNAHVFFGLVLIQALILCAIVAWRFRRGKTWRDPLVLGVGVFVTVNGLLTMDWPWYGT